MNSAPVTRTLAIVCVCIAVGLCNLTMVSAETIITINALDPPHFGDVTATGGLPSEINIEEGAVVVGNVIGIYSDDPEIFNIINVSGGSISESVIGGVHSGVVASSNMVNISGGAIGGSVVGIATDWGHLSGSSGVHISGGTIGGSGAMIVVAKQTEDEDGNPISETITFEGGVVGAFTAAGNVSDNSIVIEDAAIVSGISTIGGTTINTAYGGFTEIGNATNNTVNVSSGTVGDAYSGFSGLGDVWENTFNFSGGTINDIAAGYTLLGESRNNLVNLTGETGTINGDVSGGYSFSVEGVARHNKVSIDFGGTSNGMISGGRSDFGDTSDNEVFLERGNVSGITGGYADHGITTRNNVYIYDGFAQTVYGGYTVDGIVEENLVTINGATATVGTVAGGFNDLGNVSNNQVEILDVNGVTSIYGGQSNQGDARDNSITVNGGTFRGGMLSGGGSMASGHAMRNSIAITGGNGVLDDVYGGRAVDGDATNNEIIISDGSINITSATGGFSAEGMSLDNTIEVTGGTIGSAYGGASGYNAATGNSVTVANSAFTGGTVAGGTSSQSGDATNNMVIITGDTSGNAGNIYGGSTQFGDALENTIAIENGMVGAGVVAGGYSESGSANDNIVTISSSGSFGSVYGGRAGYGEARGNELNLVSGRYSDTIAGGYSLWGPSADNKVTIGESAILSVYGGASGYDAATGNSITVANSEFTGGTVAGGASSQSGDAISNMVIITGDTSGNAGNIYGGSTQFGNALGNTIAIENGRVGAGVVAGGYSESGSANNNTVTISSSGSFGSVHGGRAGYGSASGNTLDLAAGRYDGTIAGGYSLWGPATDNTVTIGESAILNAGVLLYGGWSGDGMDSRSGNTLNLRRPVTIQGLDNFENYNFIIPPSLTANDTLVTVTAGNGEGGPIHLSGTQVMVGMEQPNMNLRSGDNIVLIDERGGFGFDGSPANATSNGATVGLLDYEFDLSVVQNQLLASITEARGSEAATSLSEGFVSGVVLGNLGADAIAGPAMDSALASVHAGAKTGLGGFGSLVAGKSRYKTGSHMDMLGVSAAAGLAYGINYDERYITVGPFLEYGKGDYDSFSLDGEREVRGSGDSEYMGGGFLLRWDEKDAGKGRYFAEASFRVGRLTNDFSSSDILTASDQPVAYDTSGVHYGMHFGYGGGWNLSERTGLEVYGKYFYSRGESDAVALSSGEPIRFDEVTSHRLRGGARLSLRAGQRTTLLFGGAYEHQLDGWVDATVSSYVIDAPTLKGGTGIGEFILSYKPSAIGQTSINVGVQGFGGKREGVAGNIFVRF